MVRMPMRGGDGLPILHQFLLDADPEQGGGELPTGSYRRQAGLPDNVREPSLRGVRFSVWNFQDRVIGRDVEKSGDGAFFDASVRTP